MPLMLAVVTAADIQIIYEELSLGKALLVLTDFHAILALLTFAYHPLISSLYQL